MLSKLKDRVKFIFEGFASAFHGLGLTPNIVSTFSLLCAALSALVYVYRPWGAFFLLAAALLLLGGFFDGVDGAMADLYGQRTKLGAFLDSIFDRVSEALVISSIMIAGLCDVKWGLVALIASLLVSYSRARAESVGVNLMGVGVAERPERTLILASATVTNLLWNEAISVGISLIAVLSMITLAQRIIGVRSALK